tara:strand:- start:561 stop:1760 length:1200 start_codon:yes stop_codon:yes gene_type:complete
MAKNTHLEHLEDDIFNQGYAGATNAVKFLESLRDMLTTGKGGKNTKVTVKWDGAPAIICGTDPQTGEFFVGTKSVFNKTSPKICYTDEFIDFHYPNGAIAGILKQCLKELKKLPIKGVVQGDLLYTKRPNVIAMRGQPCYNFKPNTITYVIPKHSELGAKVAKSKLGIVFHTSYSGSTIGDMSAGFGVDVSGMQGVKDVAVFSSTFQNTNGIANLNPGEITRLNSTISKAERSLVKGKKFLDEIQKAGGPQTFSPPALFKIYFNQVIRGGNVPSAEGIAAGYINFVTSKYDDEIKKKKTEKSQQEWQRRKVDALAYLNNNKSVMIHTFTGFKDLISAKEQVINKLTKIEGVGTFLEDEKGYRVTSPEGFVAIMDGQAIKLVDRLEFSRANFTVAKDWGK